MRVPPSQSCTRCPARASASSGSRLVSSRLIFGEARGEDEGMHLAPGLGHRMQEMQEEPGIFRHRARDIDQCHHRRLADGAAGEGEIDGVTTRAQRTLQRPAHVNARAARVGPETTGDKLLRRQAQLADQTLGARDLGGTHLGEILAAQHFAIRNRQPRGEYLLLLLDLRLLARRLEGLGHPRGGGARLVLVLALARRHGRHLGDQLLDQRAAAPEQAKRLVENDRMLMLLHEDGVQRPVEILALADPRRLHRVNRIYHRRRADGETGCAQGAGKIGDVLGELAAILTHASIVVPHQGRGKRASCTRGRESGAGSGTDPAQLMPR